MGPLVDATKPIAVVATSGAYNPARFEAGLGILRDAGFDPQPLPGHLDPHRYLAAPDAVRRTQLQHAMSSDAYSAVWLARGGYGITRVLDGLDLGSWNKPLIGFSDMTALMGPMRTAGVGPAIHGPVVHSLPGTDATSREHLWALLSGDAVAPMHGTQWSSGQASGPLVGGNLCMLASTCGTPAQLDSEGCILVLEEVGEYAYRVDRMLQQLASSGVFDGVVGVALGEFTNCRVPEDADWDVVDILQEYLAPLGVPIVADLPIGHGSANRAWVVGGEATLGDGALTLARAAGA